MPGSTYSSAEDNEDSIMASATALSPSTTSRIKTKARTSSTNPTEPAKNATLSTPPSKPTPTFSDLGVVPWLVTSLAHLSISHPTRIQSACIPPILAGHDCIGGSQTGSGKTAAFAVPILQNWSEDPSSVYAVILTPTRELALQIHEQIIGLGTRRGLRCALVTGGADMRQQALELSRKPHIVVATPGRLADHVSTSGEETVAALRRVKFVVLDEADRLLAGGNGSMLDDLETCLQLLPPPGKRQTLLFTATVTPEVRALEEMPRKDGRGEVFVCEVDTEEKMVVPKGLKQTYVMSHLSNLRLLTLFYQIPTRQPPPQRKIPPHPPPHPREHLQIHNNLLQPHLHRHTNRIPSPPAEPQSHSPALRPPTHRAHLKPRPLPRPRGQNPRSHRRSLSRS